MLKLIIANMRQQPSGYMQNLQRERLVAHGMKGMRQGVSTNLDLIRPALDQVCISTEQMHCARQHSTCHHCTLVYDCLLNDMASHEGHTATDTGAMAVTRMLDQVHESQMSWGDTDACSTQLQARHSC